MGTLSSLPNIGKVVEQQLIRAGIETPEQLREAGAREAWLRIQAFDPSACIHRLYSFEAAIRGVRKSELDPQVKAGLKAFYNQHRAVL